MTRRIQYTHIPGERTTLPATQITRGFVFAPRFRSANKTGDANHFQNGARQFARRWGLADPFFFDNDGNNDANHIGDHSNPWRRRRDILDAIDAAEGSLDVVAYCGHGSSSSLLTSCFGLTALPAFAAAIARKASPRLVVVLYACSAGKPGGFADNLSRALTTRGIRATVFGHDSSGDAYANPTKRRYPGGQFIIEPSHHPALRGDLWMRFPFMEPQAVAAELR